MSIFSEMYPCIHKRERAFFEHKRVDRENSSAYAWWKKRMRQARRSNSSFVKTPENMKWKNKCCMWGERERNLKPTQQQQQQLCKLLLLIHYLPHISSFLLLLFDLFTDGNSININRRLLSPEQRKAYARSKKPSKQTTTSITSHPVCARKRRERSPQPTNMLTWNHRSS